MYLLQTLLHQQQKRLAQLVVSEKFVDWRQCAAVMDREAVTVMPSCSGGGNVVVA
jgi:hypothetical protein